MYKRQILGVASSKPDGMVKRILEHFGLAKYFHEIVGSDPEKMKMSKADVIEIILERLGYRDRRGEAVMIGDLSLIHIYSGSDGRFCGRCWQLFWWPWYSA